MDFPGDANALLTGSSARFVFAAPLCLQSSLLDLFEIGPAAARRLTEDEAGDQPTGEPQSGDEVGHVTSSEDHSDRQESADHGDDRADACSGVPGIGHREQGDADRNRAEPAGKIEKVVGKGREHRACQCRDGVLPAHQERGRPGDEQAVSKRTDRPGASQERRADDETSRDQDRQAGLRDRDGGNARHAVGCHPLRPYASMNVLSSTCGCICNYSPTPRARRFERRGRLDVRPMA